MSSQTLIQSLADFLSQYLPFKLMKLEDVFLLAEESEIQYYDRESYIFRQNQDLLEHCFVVKKGGVHFYSDGKEIDYSGRGDMFGLRAVLANDYYLMDAVVEKEAIVIHIKSSLMKGIIESEPKVSNFVVSGLASGKYQGNRVFLKEREVSPKEEISFNIIDEKKKIEVSPTQRPIVCNPEDTIQEVATLMSQNNIGSVIVVNEKKNPIGIITHKDLLDKVVSKNINSGTISVSEIMSSPVHCLKNGMIVSDLVILMSSIGVHHFCVTKTGKDNSEVIGIVSHRDILEVLGNNPATIFRLLKKTEAIEKLVELRDKAERYIAYNLEAEVSVTFISDFITQVNDILIKRAIEFAEETLLEQGIKPVNVPFSWISLGSEGRKEQILSTDLDNAIIYEDVPEERQQTVQKYFLALGEEVINILVKCGFERCKGNIMASNPQWNQPFSEWKKYFTKWMSILEPQSSLYSSIFFDLRTTYGTDKFEKELRQYIFDFTDNKSLIFSFFASNTLKYPPPLSMFRKFITQKDKSKSEMFEIKTRTMAPLVDAARLLMLFYKIDESHSTFDRFENIGKKDRKNKDLWDSASQAYQHLMKYRALEGIKNHNSGSKIKIDNLNELQKKYLKNIFYVVREVQSVIKVRMSSGFFQS